jgi:orotidine-5'-phosphate decarboxylase
VDFADRAVDSMRRHGPLVFGLDPSAEILELWGLGDSPDGLDRFVDIALETCPGTVGMVKPQAAFYERLGWRGIKSLSRLITSAREAGLMVILDAKRGDVGSTMEAYAEAYLGENAALRVDAITATPYLGFDTIHPMFDLAADSSSCVLVVTRSSNSEGRSLQEARHPDGTSVEERILEEIASANNRLAPERIGPVGSVFGPTHGPPLFDLCAPNCLYLAPGVGAQGATAKDVARCFATCPDRVLPSASRELLRSGPNVSAMRSAALVLSAELSDLKVGP